MNPKRPPPQSIRRTWWLVASVIAAGAAFAVLMMRDGADRLPKPNRGPGVAASGSTREFVGAKRCAECHGEMAASFSKTGHARTFAQASRSEAATRLQGTQFADPEREQTFHYRVDPQQGLVAELPDRYPGRPFPLQIVLGSGGHAQTFLTLIPGEDGRPRGLEHRVSLFAGSPPIGLTPSHPGTTATGEVEAFGKIVDTETTLRCLGCHTTAFEIAGDQLRHAMANVQCEACHGPGSAHVEEGGRTNRPKSIVRLGAATPVDVRRQIDRCGDCHRRPDNVTAAELRPDNPELVRFQPIGLLQSKCFVKSGEMLACSACHNLHAPLNQQADANESCLQCHAAGKAGTTSCRVSETGCVDCHMPQVTLYQSISFRDHWIRVRK